MQLLSVSNYEGLSLWSLIYKPWRCSRWIQTACSSTVKWVVTMIPDMHQED